MNAKVSKSKVMRKAWEIFKAGTHNFALALKEAWKQVRLIAAALKDGVVTFWKEKTGEKQVRRIAPLANFDYERKTNAATTATVKVVDLDKYEAGKGLNASIISFNGYQVEETINAAVIAEELEVDFANQYIDFDQTTNTITVMVKVDGGETIPLAYRPTLQDDCASVADKFRELLEDALQEYEKESERADRNWVNWHAEQGYGCTGQMTL